MSEPRHPLVVLLGPDYAGKSSLLRELWTHGDWRVVSCDEPLLPAPYATLGELRRLFFGRVLPAAAAQHSPDFLLSGLQMSLVYLRDRAQALAAHGPTLVDSYYYKVLAKCRLAGFESDEIFALWRRFPRPDRVIYLNVSPKVAWTRANAAPNPFEHYGPLASRGPFERFQRDLDAQLRREIAGLPIDEIDAERDAAAVTAAVLARLSSDPAERRSA